MKNLMTKIRICLRLYIKNVDLDGIYVIVFI